MASLVAVLFTVSPLVDSLRGVEAQQVIIMIKKKHDAENIQSSIFLGR